VIYLYTAEAIDRGVQNDDECVRHVAALRDKLAWERPSQDWCAVVTLLYALETTGFLSFRGDPQKS